MDYIVYDIEITKAVPGSEPREDGILYCNGWQDHENMGVACVGLFESWSGRYRVFFEDNREKFAKLMEATEVLRDPLPLVGFNNIRFDNAVLQKTGWLDETWVSDNTWNCYDILRELWIAKGMDPDKFEDSHRNHGLDACAKANFGVGKTGWGGSAPIDFQRGRYGSLIDYCLADVRLTDRLFQRILRDGFILDPVDPSHAIPMRQP